LTLEAEALIVALRRHTLLPLDDCLYALQATLPHLTRSALHRCLQRHGMSRLPNMASAQPEQKRLKACPIGSCHIDIAEVRTEAGKLSLLVAIDRSRKFADAELHAEATNMVAAQFLRNVMGAGKELCKILAQGFDLAWSRREPEFFRDRWRHTIKA
jgi:hypothetical protein